MKSIEEIYQKMQETFKERAGFWPGDSCELSVRLWAAAAQIQALDIRAAWVLDQSFPQTAEGVYLDRHAAMRGISRLPAAKAVGTLRFFTETAAQVELTIPAGTVCMRADGRRYQTLQPARLQVGETSADAPAEAVEGGASGNAAAESICVLTACPVAVTGCTNPDPFTGGSDAEEDDALRGRVLESYRRLPNGANAAWYESTAMARSGVAAAKAVGRARGIGTVDVYVATAGGAPEPELLEALRAELAEKREIAVDVQVKAPVERTVDVTVELTADAQHPFQEVRTAAEQAVAGFFSGRLLGRPVRLAELGKLLFSVEGVENYHILAPAADLPGDDTVLPVLGKLTITGAEE